MLKRVICLTLVSLLLAPIANAGSQFRTELSQKAIDDFVLIDQNGEAFSSSDIDAEIIVLSFVFTTCPDFCPSLTQTLISAQNSLSEDVSKRVAFISISVDPEYDTPEKMKLYSEHHGADWPHLTGTEDELKEVWQDVGIGVLTIEMDDGMSDEHDGMKNHSMTHQIITVLPDGNSSIAHAPSSSLPSDANAWNLTKTVYEEENIPLNYSTSEWGNMVNGISGHMAPDDNSWWWELRFWNTSSSSWEASNVGADSLLLSQSQHIAWAPNSSSLTDMPIPECSGHGWVMGTGDHAHCMCDERYSWGDGDDSVCVQSESVTHNPYTYILDSKLKPRVKFTGDQWKSEELVADINKLADDKNDGGLPGFGFGILLSALIVAIAWYKY